MGNGRISRVMGCCELGSTDAEHLLCSLASGY